MSSRLLFVAAALLTAFVTVASAEAATTVVPPFDADYTLVDLGPVAGVPTNYGGLTFLPGDPNTIIIGGAANGSAGKIYRIGVVRDIGGHITGFADTAVLYCDGGNNDGGVVFGPGNVLLLARYNQNELAQLKPGSTTFDKVTSLTPLGVASSIGGFNFVPAGFPGAGQFKMVSYNAYTWYTVPLTPDGAGTFTVGTATLGPTLVGGPEGFIYVPPGSPRFTDYQAVLVSEYQGGAVVAYTIDVNGDPIPATRTPFVTGLTGAEGAVTDPVTGDFLFSTYGGGNHVVAVHGFAPPPTTTTTSSSTSTSTSTSPPLPTTTTTTLPVGCDLAQLAQDSLAGVECAIATVGRTLAEPPQPECVSRCRCSLRDPLDRVVRAVNQAKTASGTKACRRKLDSARRVAKTLGSRVKSAAKRACLAPTDRSTRLVAQTKDLANRTKALFKSGFCTMP